MIDFELSVKLRIGDAGYGEPRPSIFSKLWLGVKNRIGRFWDFVEFLKNDVEENYRYTFDEGHDAYMILYDKNYPEGFYNNANNPKDYFYKSYDENGNSIATFVIPDVYVQNSVQRMEGLQMTPTDMLQSISVAEIYLTNCDDSNIDQYIPLRTSYSQTGIATVSYGRNSKFQVVPEYFENFIKSMEMELASVREWLANYQEEEPDLIDLMAIQRRDEMQAVAEKQAQRSRKTRRVQPSRN